MTIDSIIPQGGRLAALLAQGYRITYAEDPVFPGSWFADLRDQLGRVWQSGGGSTQAEAAQRVAERVERDGAPVAAGALDALIAAHTARGYEVAFSVGGGADGFFAHVENDNPDEGCTAGGKTLAEALWAASPLHAAGDGELVPPFPGGELDDLANDLHAEMDTITERVAALEDFQRSDLSLLLRAMVDLHKRVYPDGIVARDGDGPRTVCDQPVSRCTLPPHGDDVEHDHKS